MPQSNRFEKLNLFVNVLGIILIPTFGLWIVWTINSKFQMERDSEDKYNASMYLPKAWFLESQKETNSKIDGLQADVSVIKQNMANLQGQLGNTIHTKP